MRLCVYAADAYISVVMAIASRSVVRKTKNIIVIYDTVSGNQSMLCGRSREIALPATAAQKQDATVAAATIASCFEPECAVRVSNPPGPAD